MAQPSWQDLSALFGALTINQHNTSDRKHTHHKDAKELASVHSPAAAGVRTRPAPASAAAAPAAMARPRTAADPVLGDWSAFVAALPAFEPLRLASAPAAVARPVELAAAPAAAARPADDAKRRSDQSHERVQRFFRDNQPLTTKSTYSTYQKRYVGFMRRKHYPLYGPDTSTYASEFLVECSLGGHGNKPLASTTILGPVAGAIADFYRFDSEWPTISKIFKQTKTVVRKVARKPRAAKEPLPIQWLKAAVDAALHDKNRETGLRDTLIMLIMYGAFLREAEVVALKPLNVQSSTVTVNGVALNAVTIRVEHAKNDQEGVGSDRTVPELPGSSMCMYTALLEYQSIRLYSCGLMFYNTQKNKRGQKLSSKTPTHILRARLSEAKMPPSELKKFASNSLRKGGVTRAISEGNSRDLVKQHGAWRSDAGVNAYISADKSALAQLVQSIFVDSEDEIDDDDHKQ